MAIEVRHRRGTGTEHTTFTGASAEITVDTTDDRLVVHDGVTAGGHPVAKEDEMLKLSGGTMTGDIDMNGNDIIGFNSGGSLFKGNNGEVGSSAGDIFRRSMSSLPLVFCFFMCFYSLLLHSLGL